MMSTKWMGRLLAIATLLGSTVGFANDPFSRIKDGYERVIVRGSTTEISGGQRLELGVPFGLADVDRVLVQANARCGIAKIKVQAVLENGTTKDGSTETISGPVGSWYFFHLDAHDATKIYLTHECGASVDIGKVEADVSIHPVVMVLNQVQTQLGTQPSLPYTGPTLSDAIDRKFRSLNSGKFRFLFSSLETLIYAIKNNHSSFRDDEMTAALEPIAVTLLYAKVKAQNSDGNVPLMKLTTEVVALIDLAEAYLVKKALNPASKQISEAIFLIADLLITTARIDKEDIEEAKAKLCRKFFNGDLNNPAPKKQSKVGQQVVEEPEAEEAAVPPAPAQKKVSKGKTQGKKQQ